MKSFVGRFFSKSRDSTTRESEGVTLEPVDLYAFDVSLLKSTGVPFYPLNQVLKNRAEIPKFQPSSEDAKPMEKGEPSNELVTLTMPLASGRYIDEAAIGEGGTAVVFRSTDTRLKREVALKRFKDNADGQNLDYLAELESVSRLRHHNVVTTFDADVDEKGSFIVMELIDGIDAETMVAKEKRTFDVNQFTNFALQALEGLNATHEGGLLHLDLKPSNIMIVELVSGRFIVKIVDYGRATLIRDSDGNPPKGRGLDGSIYYAAPEQLLEEELDQRADLYALGCVFYWVLCAKMPFVGRSVIEVMSSHLQHIVVPLADVEPTIPHWLSDWVMGMISLRKEHRPSSAHEAIELLLNGDQGQKITRIKG